MGWLAARKATGLHFQRWRLNGESCQTTGYASRNLLIDDREPGFRPISRRTLQSALTSDAFAIWFIPRPPIRLVRGSAKGIFPADFLASSPFLPRVSRWCRNDKLRKSLSYFNDPSVAIISSSPPRLSRDFVHDSNRDLNPNAIPDPSILLIFRWGEIQLSFHSIGFYFEVGIERRS